MPFREQARYKNNLSAAKCRVDDGHTAIPTLSMIQLGRTEDSTAAWRRDRIRRIAWPIFILAAAFSLLLLRGDWFALLTSPAYLQAVSKYGEVIRLIDEQHIDPSPGFGPLTDQAIGAALRSLDAYSGYMPASHYTLFNDESEQRYVGIGIEIEQINREFVLGEVFENSPASEAGLQTGDRIVQVEGELIDNLSLGGISSRLRGEEGTSVEITVFRPSASREFTSKVTRKTVHFPRIRDIQHWSHGVASLRISQFGLNTAREFFDEVAELRKAGFEKLVIDLRSNPGGVLNEALKIADAFVERRERLLSIQRRGETVQEYKARSSAPLADLAVIILVDKDTASAAEILAGVLQDYSNALLIGERTFGKGLIQSVYRFGDGSGLRLTTSQYVLPGGRTVQDTGIQPDIEFKAIDHKTMIERIMRSHRDLPPDAFRERFGFDPQPDQVMAEAVEILQGIGHLAQLEPMDNPKRQ